MALLPAILVHNLYVGVAGFTLTLFFMGIAGAPLWTAAIDIAPAYAGTASALMNAAGAVAGMLSPAAFGVILQLTGSWTLPFAIVVTFWIRPDRPIEAVTGFGGLAVAGE